MRIVFVLGSLHLGGAERQALLLARCLSHVHRADVEMWGFGQPGALTTLCEDQGLTWRALRGGWSRNWVLRALSLGLLLLYVRQGRPSVILAYTMVPNVMCGLVWPYTGARLCVWNQRDVGLHRMGLRLERGAAHRMSRFLANSQAGCEFLVRELSVRRSLVRVVHNGVELPPAVAGRVTWRKRLEVDDTVFVACMLGHLTQRKDHLTLLQAWSQVVERRHAVLVVAGHLGPGYGRAKNLVEELGLGQHVRFLGFVSDVAGLLSAADIGVFSSRSEGCPNGVLECMAAGLPVVATDIAGVREALGSAGAPFLAPPGDSDTLAQRILWLADARDVRAEAARSNRERAASVFSPRRMCELTLEWLCDGLADCS